MSVRGNCSAVLVCVLVMRHWRLKVAIIAPASWTNKGCEQVHTQFVLEKLVWHCVGVNLQVIHLHIFSLSLHNCFFVCGALHFYNKSFKYIFQSFVPQSSILYVTFPHSAVGCLGSMVINRNKEVGREVDICRGAVTIGPRKQTWSFFLFLFRVGLLTDNVTLPAHKHWLRQELLPSFHMACICLWNIYQTNIVLHFLPTH